MLVGEEVGHGNERSCLPGSGAKGESGFLVHRHVSKRRPERPRGGGAGCRAAPVVVRAQQDDPLIGGAGGVAERGRDHVRREQVMRHCDAGDADAARRCPAGVFPFGHDDGGAEWLGGFEEERVGCFRAKRTGQPHEGGENSEETISRHSAAGCSRSGTATGACQEARGGSLGSSR